MFDAGFSDVVEASGFVRFVHVGNSLFHAAGTIAVLHFEHAIRALDVIALKFSNAAVHGELKMARHLKQ